MNSRKNAMRIPLDISWIKAHLGELIERIEEISKQIVYKVDADGNVTFFNNVTINNGASNEDNLSVLIEIVNKLKQQIEQIEISENINELISNLEYVKNTINELQNTLLGIYRDDMHSITHVTDNLEIHNDIVLNNENDINATIICKGGHLGFHVDNSSPITDYTKTSFVRSEGIYIDERTGQKYTTYYNWLPTDSFNTVSTPFVIHLLNGKRNENNITFSNVFGEIYIDFPTSTSLSGNEYGYVLHFTSGTAICDTTSLSVTINISEQSEFTRSEFKHSFQNPVSGGSGTVEFEFPKAVYKFDQNTTQSLTFTTTNYHYSAGVIEAVVSSGNKARLYISSTEEQRTILIKDNSQGTVQSRLIFTYSNTADDTTYLDANGEFTEAELKELLHVPSVTSTELTKLQKDGLVVSSYPETTPSQNIMFQGPGSITSRKTTASTSTDVKVIETADGEIQLNNVKKIEFNNKGDVYQTIVPGKYTYKYKYIDPDTHEEEEQTEELETIKINSNAVFTYTLPNQTEPITVSIEDLRNSASDIKELKQLTDRVITLERANMYAVSSFVESGKVIGTESPTDASVYSTYYVTEEMKPEEYTKYQLHTGTPLPSST